MAIGEKAGSALVLLGGVRNCKDGGDDPSLWQGIAARLVMDLDGAGNQAGVEAALAVLEDLWLRLPAAGEARETPKVSPTGDQVADVITSQLARALTQDGMSEAAAVRNAERYRRTYARIYGRDDGCREMPAMPLTPREQYERAAAEFGEAASSAARAREMARRMTEEADRAYQAAEASLRRFEESPGIPKAEYAEEAPSDGNCG